MYLKNSELSKEATFLAYSYSAYSNIKLKFHFFSIMYVKNSFIKICPFSDTFLAIKINAATDNFLANCFHIQKGLSIYYQNCKFSAGSKELFLFIWPWSSKAKRLTRGLWQSTPWKALWYYKSYDTSPKTQSLANFLFFLAPCHFVLIKSSIKGTVQRDLRRVKSGINR
jgi:hypothetical protein